MNQRQPGTVWMITFGAYGVIAGKVYCDIGWIHGGEYAGPIPEACWLAGFIVGAIVGLVFESLFGRKAPSWLSSAMWIGIPILIIALGLSPWLQHHARE